MYLNRYLIQSSYIKEQNYQEKREAKLFTRET